MAIRFSWLQVSLGIALVATLGSELQSAVYAEPSSARSFDKPLEQLEATETTSATLDYGGLTSADVSSDLTYGDASCDGGCDCCDKDLLLGYVRATDTCYSDFISPITNPVFFEDPRNVTEARLIFMNHTLPPGLGRVQLFALQIRVALTERLSLIATKDGFITSDNGVPAQDGWADVAAGLKYLLYADACQGRLVSAGVTFELPVGSTRALQGNGDGEFNMFLTAGQRFWGRWHYLTTTGFRLPSDSTAENQYWYWSNHIDRQIGCNFYALTEINWFHVMKDGDVNGALNGLSGMDLYNFGNQGVAGNDLVTGAIGLKYVPRDNMEIGVAWEVPLTTDRDILDNRLTADWIVRY